MMRHAPILAVLALATGGAAAHDLGIPAGVTMSCESEPRPVFAKIQLSDEGRAHPTEGPLMHATLFDGVGAVVPHVAIYSHYFMNCRVTDRAPPVPEGFEPAFEAWLDNGASPILNAEPAEIFREQAGSPPS